MHLQLKRNVPCTYTCSIVNVRGMRTHVRIHSSSLSCEFNINHDRSRGIGHVGNRPKFKKKFTPFSSHQGTLRAKQRAHKIAIGLTWLIMVENLQQRLIRVRKPRELCFRARGPGRILDPSELPSLSLTILYTIICVYGLYTIPGEAVWRCAPWRERNTGCRSRARCSRSAPQTPLVNIHSSGPA
jgi:hypothetical protein